jgi:hypothetical protein
VGISQYAYFTKNPITYCDIFISKQSDLQWFHLFFEDPEEQSIGILSAFPNAGQVNCPKKTHKGPRAQPPTTILKASMILTKKTSFPIYWFLNLHTPYCAHFFAKWLYFCWGIFGNFYNQRSKDERLPEK